MNTPQGLPGSGGRRGRRSSLARAVLLAFGAALLLALGFALGRTAAGETPPVATQTLVRTLRPLPLRATRETVTVTVTGTTR